LKTHLEENDIRGIAEAIMETLKPILVSNGKHEAEDKWLNVKSLSDYMGMSSQWIYNNKGKLPHVNIGNKPLFRKSDIDAWLVKQRVEHNEDTVKPDASRVSNFKSQNPGR
jgi:predicted DNA-binding transcriptional regulator AlpA